MLMLNRMVGFGSLRRSAAADEEPYSGYFDGVADGVANSTLTRTPGSNGNGQKFTISCWALRDAVPAADWDVLFSAGTSTNMFMLGFYNNTIAWHHSQTSTIASSSTFSSTSTWYHVVCAVDTTQVTDTNRVKIWVNNVAQTLSVAAGSIVAQNTTLHVNQSTKAHWIGNHVPNSAHPYNGSIADFCLIDGQALDPTSFGVSVSGVWSHKNYAGSYGTQGHRVRFAPASLPNDQSGNGLNYTNNGVVCDLRTPTRSATVVWKTTENETGTITLPSNSECVAALWGQGSGGEGSTAGSPGGGGGGGSSTTFNSSAVVASAGSGSGGDFSKANSGSEGASRAGNGGGGGTSGTGGKGQTFYTGSSGSGGYFVWKYYAAGAIGTGPTYRVGLRGSGGGGDAPGGDGGQGYLRVVYR